MRRVLGFACRFAVAYGLFVLLWVTTLEERYNDYLAWSCTRLLSSLEEPELTSGIKRDGGLLIVDHVPHFARVPRQEIVMRRVNSNSSLFVALTIATPGVGWMTRGLWLLGGGALLSASHIAHVISFVHQHYALRNVGQYFTRVPAAELRDLGISGLMQRPAARRRALALATANIFNIVLQRVVPIVLWLPLLFGVFRRRDDSRPPSGRPGRKRQWLWAGSLAGVAFLAGTLLTLHYSRRARSPQSIEGVRLGMGAVAARRVLEKRGYDWARGWYRERQTPEAVVRTVSLWPRRGPLMARRYGPRYNWVGLEVAIPRAGPRGLFSGCVSGIRTAASDSLPESYNVEAKDPVVVCGKYWKVR